MFNIKNIDRICIVVIVLVVGALGFFSVKKTLAEKVRIRQQNILLSARVKDLNSAETSLKQLQRLLNVTQKRFKQLDSKIPESAEIGTLIHQLDELIKTRRIILISLIPQPAVKEKQYTQIPIRMIFKGLFKDVYLFINDLENMTRLLSMDQLVISGVSQDKMRHVDLVASVFERGQR